MLRIYRTAQDGSRLKPVKPCGADGAAETVTVRSDKTYQTHLGFGGAFTEASAICYNSLGKKKRDEVVRAYYSEDGLRYNLGRIPVHSTDFSPQPYIYTEDGDLTAESFDISCEEQKRLPFIKKCMEAAGDITFFAAPWSPPAYMKENGAMQRGGRLKEDCKRAWARYYARFLLGMRERGVKISYVGVQNEPEAVQTWESREVSAEEEALEIRDFLAPEFERCGLDVRFTLWDHNRDRAVARCVKSLSVDGVSQYVWGIAYHWYCCDKHENLSALHELFPDKHLLLTECCVELAHDSKTGKSSVSGLWEHGERYGRQIIRDFENWSEGYIDWNLMLDDKGGPTYVGNFCESPVMLDGKGGVVYNPSYYYIAHFSRFIDAGASRIFCAGGGNGLYQTAYKNPDGKIIIVIMNATASDKRVTIDADGNGFGAELCAHSIITAVYDEKI